jgi:hypothetical protein
MVDATRTRWRPSTAASCPHSDGTTTVSASKAATIGTTPGTRRNEPSRPSSPRKAHPATASGGSSPPATSSPTAMGRSSPGPPLRTPPGARLTVIRLVGKARPLDMSAARTLSRDSLQAVSGRPTTW